LAVQPVSVGQCRDRYWMSTEIDEGNTFQVTGTIRRHCPVENKST
jgi:hypothetical protein